MVRTSGYTVVDVETTGLSPTSHDRIVEIAVVYVSESGQLQDRWSTLVNPGRDVGPTNIHGITASDVRGAPTFAEIAPYVLRAVSGRTVVAHNASFDTRFLADELIRSGVALEEFPLPALCTMRWSGFFLQSPSRRLVDCCTSCGVPLGNAHSAADDALATARLLSHYLRCCNLNPPWTAALDEATEYPWPPFRGDYSPLHLAPRGQASVTRQRSWLDLIVSSMPHAAEPSVDAYLNVLEMALLDGFLAEHEKSALVAVAREHGLSRGQVMDIHSDYLRALAEVALSDGVVTAKEQADLELVARLLDLPSSDVAEALRAAEGPISASSLQATTADRFSTTGIVLHPGDGIAFTGAMACERTVWEQRVARYGLIPGGLTKRTRLLVAADPNSLSGKATKARSYGIPIISEGGFSRLLTTLQPQHDPAAVG